MVYTTFNQGVGSSNLPRHTNATEAAATIRPLQNTKRRALTATQVYLPVRRGSPEPHGQRGQLHGAGATVEESLSDLRLGELDPQVGLAQVLVVELHLEKPPADILDRK